MKIIKQSCENEMVCEFLKMEYASERFAVKLTAIIKELQADETLILNGNLQSERENALRKEILKRFRGYRDSEIFENFPKEINWNWAVFDREDISKILYIEYSYWNELSNYTGSPLEAAKTIRAGIIIYDVPNDGFIEAAHALKQGVKFPPLIFLSDRNENRYIILEGHKRMTAYGLEPEFFRDIPVLLGICGSEELDKWYGFMPPRH